MFLHSLLEDRLLSDKSGTHILKKFKVQTSRALVSTLVNYFHEPATDDVALLSTSAHVLWSMEMIGHAFSCPIEDEKIIDQALELYSRWMFAAQRPIPIAHNEDNFLKEMFQHISMLFAPRKSYSGDELKRHTSLCTKALEMYSSVARQLGRRLSVDGWDCLVKVVLGICDHLLKGPSDVPSLGNSLETLLLRVLFDVWLRSGITDPQLWKTFSKFAGRWVHRRWFLTEWRHTSFALTRKLLRLMYDGGSSSNDPISIRWSDNYNTIVMINDKKLVYTWHQMYHLIGNPSKFNEPDTFLLAVQGMSEIAECFLSAGALNAPLRKLKTVKPAAGVSGTASAAAPSGASASQARFPIVPPNGNFIITAFGPWLLDVAFMSVPAFEEGRATALGALCRIFCSPTGHDWNPDHLSSFYRCIITALSTQPTDSIAVMSIIANIALIFTRELTGSFILVQHLVPHIRYILSNAFDVEIRRSCLTMLASMLALATHTHIKYGTQSTASGVSLNTGYKNAHATAAAAAANSALESKKPASAASPPPVARSLAPTRPVPAPPKPASAGPTGSAVTPPTPVSTPPPVVAASSSGGGAASGSASPLPSVSPAYEPESKARQAEREAEPTLETHLRGVAMTLINALISERDVLNLEMILWSISIHMHEETLYPTARSTTSFANLALRTIWATLSQSNWPTKVALTCFSMLASVSDLHITIHAQNDTTIPEFIGNLTSCIEANLSGIKDYTGPLGPSLRQQRMADTSDRAMTLSALMAAALHCLHQWITAAPWIIRDSNLSHRILTCVCAGMRKADENVQHTSLTTLKFLLYDAGIHPFTPTPTIAYDPNTGAPNFPIAAPNFPAPKVASLPPATSGGTPTANGVGAGATSSASSAGGAAGSYPASTFNTAVVAPLPPLVASLSRVYSPSSSLSAPLAIALRLTPVLAYSSPLTEVAVLQHLIERGRISREATPVTHVRYYLVNARSLVSIIECEAEVHGRTEIIWFLRDMSGKYVWRTLSKLRPDTKRAITAQAAKAAPAGSGAAAVAAAAAAAAAETVAAAGGPQTPIDLLNATPYVNIGDEPDDRLAEAMRNVLAPPNDDTPVPAVAVADASDESKDVLTALRSGRIELMRDVWNASKSAGILDTVHSTARWIGGQQNKVTHGSYFTAIDTQLANEQARLEQLQPVANTLFPTPVQRPKSKKARRTIDEKSHLSASSGVPQIRLALSTMGFLAHLAPLPSSMPFHTQPLLESLHASKDLLEELTALDAIPEREVYTIAVLHRRAGQHTVEEMCRNPSMLPPANGAGGEPVPGFTAFIRGLGTPNRSDQPELEFHVPTFMQSVPTERRGEFIVHDSVRVVWSDDRTNFRLDDPTKRSKSARAAASGGRKQPAMRRPMVYIVIWPQRSGLFRVRVCSRGLTYRPSLDAKLASTGAFFDGGGSSGMGPASSGPGSGAGAGAGLSSASGSFRKPHHHSSTSAGGSGSGALAATASSGSGGGPSGSGGSSGASSSAADAKQQQQQLDDSKLRNAPLLVGRNPRLTRNGLSPYWVRSVSSVAQQVFDEWRESVTNEKPVIGPLLGDMLVNAASLCANVREACIAATRLLLQLENGVANPFQPRLTTIKRVAKQYMNSVPPAQSYHSLFMNTAQY